MTSRGKPPIGPGLDPKLRAALEAQQESLEEGEGRRGDKLKRWLRVEDLVKMGLAKVIGNRGGLIAGGDLVSTITVPDTSKPPTATGLEVTGLFTTILLRWDNANRAYRSHALTEVWRSVADDRATAVLVGQTIDSSFSDVNVTLGVTYYYWIRWASEFGEVGMWNSVAGTPGALSPDPAELLARLVGEITESHLYAALNTRLDKIEGNEVAIEVAQTIIDGHSAQFTVKIDNNGYVAGFGLASEPVDGVPRSMFLVNADRFAVSNPSVNKKSVTSLTRSGTTATAASTAHGLVVGQKIVISGATQATWNGTWTVATVPNANTFTFTVPNTLASTAGGTKYVSTGSIPFVIDSGQVIIDVAFIKDASITNAKVQNLGVEKLIGDLGEFVVANIGTGTITTAMIDSVIHSTVYTPGSVGWAIFKDGTAEFRNVIARGNIEATTLDVTAANIVSTLNVAGGAVTSMTVASGASGSVAKRNGVSSPSMTASATNKLAVATASHVMPAGSSGVAVNFSVAVYGPDNCQPYVDIYKNSTLMATRTGAFQGDYATVITSTLLDTSPAASTVYTMMIRSGENTGGNGDAAFSYSDPVITLTGGKR